jgi:DNA-binding NarL/FixJ family response regulator
MTAIIWGRKSFQEDPLQPPEDLPEIFLQQLTPMQQEVLKMVVDGRTNREIAAILEVDPQTVKSAVTSIVRTLSAATKGRHTVE